MARPASLAADLPDWLPCSLSDYRRLDDVQIRGWQRIDSWASLRAICFDWLVIAATIWAAAHFARVWLYPLAIVVIGARQQGLIVLMHEASHRKLFRRAGWNDFAGEVLLAWPFFFSMFSYRANHMAHHHHLNTELDPDWVRYLTGDAEERQAWEYGRSLRAVLLPLLTDLVGWGAAAQVRRVLRLARPRNHDPRRAGPEADEAAAARFGRYPAAWRWLFLAALILTLALTGAWVGFLLYWVVPALTVLKMCTRLRLLAGHFAINGGEGARTTLTSPLVGFFLSPHQIGYHVEHHLYPAIYFRRLPELHQRLVASGAYDGRLPLRRTLGYWNLFKEWTESPLPAAVR